MVSCGKESSDFLAVIRNRGDGLYWTVRQIEESVWAMVTGLFE